MERTSHRGFSRGANNVKQRGSGGKRGVFTIFQNLSTSNLLFFFPFYVNMMGVKGS